MKKALNLLVATATFGLLVIGLWALASGASAAALESASTSSWPLPAPPAVAAPLTPLCSPDWSVVPSPNVGAQSSYLSGVATISSSDVWAVGYYLDSSFNQITLVEHWDGTAWAIVPSPAPGLSSSNLSGVTAISSSDVWAVGQYTGATGGQTLVEHWDGSAWNVVASPNVGTSDNVLQGIAAISSSDIWAVGNSSNGFNVPRQTLVEHWDGSAWNVVSSPNVGTRLNALQGIAAISSSDIWAVGSYYDDSVVYQTLVEHWDGSAWNVVSSPNVGTSGSYLFGVAAISSSDTWAVGGYDFATTDVKTLVERYNPCPPTPTVTDTPVVATSTPTLTPTNTPVPPTSTATSTPTSTPRPNFSINISPTSATINRPGSVTYTVTLRSLNGFSGIVGLSVCGLPIQTDGIFIPPSVTLSPNGTATSFLTVIAGKGGPRGTFTLTITGTSGATGHSQNVTLIITR